MARLGVERKLARHLNITEEQAHLLVKAGFRKPSEIKSASKQRLRDAAGLTQGEANAVKARWG